MPAFSFFRLFLSTWLFALCLNAAGQTTGEGEEFETFYRRFYSDSTFQVSRVVFPLKGYNQKVADRGIDALAEGATFYTTRKDWQFLPRPPQDGERLDLVAFFRFELRRESDWVYERVWSDDTAFIIEKHFQYIRNRWWLVYYLYHEY